MLLVADTHLGYDLALRPRSARRRRGEDFFANFERVIGTALATGVDLLVHAGDLFHRSQPPAPVAERAYAPLRRLAAAGVEVLVVPGNHERARLPRALLAAHRHIHVFDWPRTFTFCIRGVTVALSGFPFYRPGVRDVFLGLLEQSGYHDARATHRLLCIHEAVEGATVGPAGFRFGAGRPDTVRARDLPTGLRAVLAGHIHRHQVLGSTPRGRLLPAPVFYPGSIERTSRAEQGETKGFLLIELLEQRPPRWRFLRLPTRRMQVRPVRISRSVPSHVPERRRP